MIDLVMFIMQLEVVLLTVFAIAGLYYGYKALGVWFDNRKHEKQAKQIHRQSAQQLLREAARRVR